MSILGIDIGTTNCKGGVYSRDGLRLSMACREYPTIQSEAGWAELDSALVVRSIFEIVQELACEARGKGDEVEAICMGSLGEAVTPVSKDRRVIGNAILHFDRRGREEIRSFLGKISPEEVYSINANIPSPVFSLAKILWLRVHSPEIYNRADKFLLFGELFFYLIGCDAVTSYSQVSRTLLFDLKKACWSERLLSLAGLHAGQFARPVPSGHVAGEVPASVAAELGLKRGVKCIVGAHDQCSNALGVGIYAPGKAVDGIGTVECITPVYSEIPDASLLRKAGLNVEHHAVPGCYVSFIYNQAGNLVKWHRDTFAKNERTFAGQSIYEALEGEVSPAPSKLFVLPHFEPTGPPDFIENSSGVILGLKTSTTRGDILKAIMESETFYFLESIETLRSMGIDTSHFVASGGGSKSDIWLQIKADIMGIPYERAFEPEAGILGAVMIASKTLGIFSSYSEACGCFVKPGRIFEPDWARHKIYREKFERYRQIYPRLKDLLQPDLTNEKGVGLKQGDVMEEEIPKLDAPVLADRLSALESLRDAELNGQLAGMPKIGPELPSYCHIHSTISYGDTVPGVFSASRMVWAAHEAGATEALLIEHESMAHMEEGIAAANIVNKNSESPLQLVFGVEFKAPISLDSHEAREFAKEIGKRWGQNEAAWIVAVGVEPCEELVRFIRQFQEAKRWRAERQLRKLSKHFGVAISPLRDFLTPEGNITDRTLSYGIAKYVNPQLVCEELEKKAKQVRGMFNPGKEGYVPYPEGLPNYQQLIRKIIDMGGIPVFTAQLRGETLKRYLPVLVSWGIRGIDVAGIEPFEHGAEDQIREFITLAKQNDLLIFGGADYRGTGTGWLKHASWMDEPLLSESMGKMISLNEVLFIKK